MDRLLSRAGQRPDPRSLRPVTDGERAATRYHRGMSFSRPLLAMLAAVVAMPAAAQEAQERPVTLGASYIADVLSVVDGGRRAGTDWLGRADLTLAVDGAAIGLDGIDFFADLLFTQSPDFSGRHVGDFQTVSNVQGDGALRPFELWAEAKLTQRLTAKAGLIDLNTEFDIQRVGAMFLNSSHGIGPDFSQSGVNGPSIFPASASAIVLRHEAGPWTTRLGLFDAIAGSTTNPNRTAFRFPGSSGALLVAEIERRIGDAEIQLGAWHYTDRFETLAGTDRAVSRGAYALIEGDIGEKVGAWARVGIAASRVNPIATYLGGGVTWGDERSQLGLAIAHARLGRTARDTFSEDRIVEAAETALELTWSHRIMPGVTLQPDLQYVINPDWDAALRDALVIGTRLRVQFGG